jgi:hypothetical protein
MKVLLIVVETPLEIKLPLQTSRKGNQSLIGKPSHLPEHPSVGIGTFSALSNDDVCWQVVEASQGRSLRLSG